MNRSRAAAASAAVLLLATLSLSVPALADNQMGYRLQSAEQSQGLQRAGGSLGMKVGPEKEITSGGMTFELLKIEGVGASSPAGQAGLKVGDQIIAVDARVFPSIADFAAYVGSIAPGKQIEIDYMPEGGGPGQAQRLGVTVGEAGKAAAPHHDVPRGNGLSTGDKVAIGVGAAAVIGCYETGCYTRLKTKLEQEREKLGDMERQHQQQH